MDQIKTYFEGMIEGLEFVWQALLKEFPKKDKDQEFFYKQSTKRIFDDLCLNNKIELNLHHDHNHDLEVDPSQLFKVNIHNRT